METRAGGKLETRPEHAQAMPFQEFKVFLELGDISLPAHGLGGNPNILPLFQGMNSVLT